MSWHRRGGPQALRDLADLGETPGPEDYPPELGWERAVWDLFCLAQSQWRVGPTGVIALDYSVYMPLIQERRWQTARVLPLLGAIERTWLADRDTLTDDPEDADGENDPGPD